MEVENRLSSFLDSNVTTSQNKEIVMHSLLVLTPGRINNV